MVHSLPDNKRCGDEEQTVNLHNVPFGRTRIATYLRIVGFICSIPEYGRRHSIDRFSSSIGVTHAIISTKSFCSRWSPLVARSRPYFPGSVTFQYHAGSTTPQWPDETSGKTPTGGDLVFGSALTNAGAANVVYGKSPGAVNLSDVYNGAGGPDATWKP